MTTMSNATGVGHAAAAAGGNMVSLGELLRAILDGSLSIIQATVATFNTTTLNVGASGTAGTVNIFPTTASKGNVAVTASANSGNTLTTLNFAAQAGARTFTVPDPGVATATVMLTGATVGTNGLTTRRLSLISDVRNSDLTVVDATGSSTKLKLNGTVGTSEDLRTPAVQNTTNTCTAMSEFVVPSGYIAAQNITLTAECKRVVASGTTLTSSLTVNAYKMADDGTAGADICATSGAQAFTSTTGIDVPFTITGTTLNPGDRLVFKMALLATEGGNAGTIASVITSLRVS